MKFIPHKLEDVTVDAWGLVVRAGEAVDVKAEHVAGVVHQHLSDPNVWVPVDKEAKAAAADAAKTDPPAEPAPEPEPTPEPAPATEE